MAGGCTCSQQYLCAHPATHWRDSWHQHRKPPATAALIWISPLSTTQFLIKLHCLPSMAEVAYQFIEVQMGNAQKQRCKHYPSSLNCKQYEKKKWDGKACPMKLTPTAFPLSQVCLEILLLEAHFRLTCFRQMDPIPLELCHWWLISIVKYNY